MYLKQRLLFPLIVVFSGTVCLAQETFRLQGTVLDSVTREPLIGATIFVMNESKGTVSDGTGAFFFQVPVGRYDLQIKYVGYRTLDVTVHVTGEASLQILLAPEAIFTKEIVVLARNLNRNTESARTGIMEITGKEIGRLPSLMGEPDLIRAIRSSPGVQGANDGNSGFYVRGGNVDQNLILLDQATVYNPSHVLGFFSIFNSDIVSQASLIKSGMPAQFGGRISSVLNVKTIDGDFDRHHAAVSVGLIYSKITLHGPIYKNRVSYYVSFRGTYVNEVLKPAMSVFAKNDSNKIFNGSKYGMFDLNAKVTARVGSRHWLSLTAYKGKDNFGLDDPQSNFTSRITWGNMLAALNWSFIIDDSSFLTSSLNFSNYDYSYDARQPLIGTKLFSSIRNYNFRLDYTTHSFFGGSLRSGLEARVYRFVPNRFVLTLNEEDLNYSNFQNLFASEYSGFASWEKDMNKKFRVYAGLRLNNYNHMGPFRQINKTTEGIVLDTVQYGSFETIRSYTNLEPRLTVRWQLNPLASLKASYTRNYQYIHVASASSVTMPSDLWIPSTRSTGPQFGDQFTLGYYRNFQGNLFTASVEAYYKTLHNQVEMLYGLGASLQDQSYEQGLATGKGYATGIEVFIQKQQGRLTGWLGYALAYSERQFDDINEGRPFPAKYDRRHEANLTLNYKHAERWDFSLAFIYATGNTMTVPVQMYLLAGNIMTEYGKINGFRMPAYHRLDLSANYYFKPRKKYTSFLNFSILNVYNRANPYLVFFEIQGNLVTEKSLSVSARQISVFPIMPSVSWTIKF